MTSATGSPTNRTSSSASGGRFRLAIGEDTPTQVRARLIVSMLLGLASGLRTFELVTPDVIESERLVATYGALVQAIIDDPAL